MLHLGTNKTAAPIQISFRVPSSFKQELFHLVLSSKGTSLLHLEPLSPPPLLRFELTISTTR